MAPRAARWNNMVRRKTKRFPVSRFVLTSLSSLPNKRANHRSSSPETHLISSMPIMVYDIPIVAGIVHSGPQAAYIANGIMLDQTNNNLDA